MIKGLSVVPTPIKLLHKSFIESLEVGKEKYKNRFSPPYKN